MTANTAATFATALRGRDVVADTSSLLVAGTHLLGEMPECRLFIPAVVVKELEDKRGHATLGFLARGWLRLLEGMRVEAGVGLSVGLPLAEHPHVTLSVEPNHTNQRCLPAHLQDGSNDSTILSVAKNLAEEGKDVVLLSNDLPMRLHATLDVKLSAIEYSTISATGAKPYSGSFTVDLTEEEYLGCSKVIQHGRDLIDIVEEKLVDGVESKWAHVQVTAPGMTKPLGDFLYSSGILDELPPRRKLMRAIQARSIEQSVAMEYLAEPAEELPLVSICGAAGTGKTLVTLAVGLEALARGEYQKLIVFRSLHEMGKGQELGFLPGSVDEKMEAWGGAVGDAIDVIASTAAGTKKGSEWVKGEVKRLRSMIEVSPITYLRGRSLSNSFIVLDEAQNFSRNELLNILSRAGEGTKMVLCYDADQVDNKFLQAGAKADIWSVVEDLKGEDLFAHITLKKTERSRVAELSARLLSAE